MAIDRIEVFVTDLPGRLQRQVSSGAYDTGPAGSLLGKPVLVKIYANGVVGLEQIRPISPGHFLPDTAHSIVGAITDIYGPRLIGKDILDLELIWSMFDKSLPGNVNARAALDHALHDAIGKALKLPVHKLLGGLAQSTIPLEWSVSMADETATMIAEATKAVETWGMKVLCLKAGSRAGWQRDVQNFAAVRKELGYDIVIGVDPNCGWSVSDAKRAVTALKDHRLDYIEQPIERRNIAGLASIRAMAEGVPVMADEGIMTLQDAHALATAQAVDVFCMKLYKMGGLRQAKKIAAVAEAADILVNFGGLAAFSQLEAAAAAHIYASTPLERTMPAGEFIFGLGVIGPDPLVPETDFKIVDGQVTPPSGPGLGVEIDETQLQRYTLRKEIVR